MILEQLSLNNFCLFRGRQTFDLSPTGRHGSTRPIVLFGGMNGGGKTTIFDAIQLALYGSRARCSKRAGRSYEEFLRASVNSAAPAGTEAGVALSFRVIVNGQPRSYEVRRDWRVHDGRVKEDLAVLQDGYPDNTLTRQWSQLVEELVPIEISQLFFFDGEKIRALAEDATSSETLGTAIRALLGLDIVERLIADSTVLQTRIMKQAGDPKLAGVVVAIEQERDTARDAMVRLKQERASLENALLQAADDQKNAEERFSLVGGKHWEEHHSRRERLAEVELLCTELGNQLVAIAGSDLPLALVSNLLTAVAEQDSKEQVAAESSFVSQMLIQRDEAVLAALDNHSEFTRSRLAILTKVLAEDRVKRSPSQNVESRLLLNEPARAHLSQLLEARLDDVKNEAARVLDRLQLASTEREDLERLLASTPNETDLGNVVELFKQSTQTHTRLQEQAEKLDDEIEARKAEFSVAEDKLNANLRADAKAGFNQVDFTQMASLAAKTREKMTEFLRRATEKKIDRLSGLITDSFRFLLRKSSLVERIQIEPGSFAVTLYDLQGHPLSRDRLSEGEKQIFAVSMLWGLARASSRPLPAIIDTPMARLDSAHRANLIDRYFPKASHQVVILSTDTEVDREYYERLRPSLARVYHLRYDEKERSAVAEEGYFWQD